MPEAGSDPAEFGDPFLEQRDPGEAAAGEIMREYLLEAAPPAKVFRQDGGDDGYALIVPEIRGERTLTVPGANESDFMLHGNPATTSDDLASFIVSAVERSRANHLQIPLLTRRQAVHLKALLNPRLTDWRLDAALTGVSPFSTKKAREPGSLRKAVRQAERDGLEVGLAAAFPEKEVKALHDEQWGPNRQVSFFAMLGELLRAGLAETIIARTPKGELVAAQVDILGTRTRHFYYGLSDTERAPGCGTAALGHRWRRFMESPTQEACSFGRGGERYKYQYAERVQEWYALRGFYAPCRSDDLRHPRLP
jgi:hypothetical protein